MHCVGRKLSYILYCALHITLYFTKPNNPYNNSSWVQIQNKHLKHAMQPLERGKIKTTEPQLRTARHKRKPTKKGNPAYYLVWGSSIYFAKQALFESFMALPTFHFSTNGLEIDIIKHSYFDSLATLIYHFIWFINFSIFLVCSLPDKVTVELGYAILSLITNSCPYSILIKVYARWWKINIRIHHTVRLYASLLATLNLSTGFSRSDRIYKLSLTKT